MSLFVNKFTLTFIKITCIICKCLILIRLMRNKQKAKIITPEGITDSGEPKGPNKEKLASTWHLDRSTPDIEMKLKDGTVIASIEFKFYNPKNPGGTILTGPARPKGVGCANWSRE